MSIRRPFPWLATGLLGIILSAALTPTAQAEGASMVRVMTYNIRYGSARDGADAWPARKETVTEVLRRADVVGLQEVEIAQLRYLREELPEFTFVGVGRADGKEGGEFSPLAVRNSRFDVIDSGTFWLSETPQEVGSQGWDAALPRIATWAVIKDRQSGVSWRVINTHFDHRGQQARVESGRLIRQRVDSFPDSDPVVVMGDLNATPDSPPLAALIAEGPRQLRDGRAVTTTPPGGPAGTWNGFTEITDLRIDHVLTTPDVTVHSYQVLDPRTPAGRFASDHLPILVTIEPQ